MVEPLVRIRILDPLMLSQNTGGEYMDIDAARAKRLVEGNLAEYANVEPTSLTTRDMRAGVAVGYETKGHNPLTHSDVFGKKE